MLLLPSPLTSTALTPRSADHWHLLWVRSFFLPVSTKEKAEDVCYFNEDKGKAHNNEWEIAASFPAISDHV